MIPKVKVRIGKGNVNTPMLIINYNIMRVYVRQCQLDTTDQNIFK